MSEQKYTEAIGRRKTSTARVRLTPASKQAMTINNKDLASYFPSINLQRIVLQGLEVSALPEKFHMSVRVQGGGIHSQAEAVRHGISRVLVSLHSDLRKKLKDEGLLKRDSRAKERRKFGLKKARKAPQWSKR